MHGAPGWATHPVRTAVRGGRRDAMRQVKLYAPTAGASSASAARDRRNRGYQRLVGAQVLIQRRGRQLDEGRGQAPPDQDRFRIEQALERHRGRFQNVDRFRDPPVRRRQGLRSEPPQPARLASRADSRIPQGLCTLYRRQID